MIINIQAPALNGLLTEIVEILNANQSNYVSTIDFLKQGILSPAAGIARLKEKGVVIETIYQTITDGLGKRRKRIACYKIVGVTTI